MTDLAMNMGMRNEKTKIRILTTGGTIEKVYDETTGSLSNRDTIVKQRFLERLRLPYTELEIKSVLSKDSLHMDDADRSKILDAVKVYAAEGAPIVVLHGTDTMEVSARFCFEAYKNVQVPVVFTGAMKPLEMEDSDAKQNIVEALMAAKLARPGYYISFHNRLFEVPNVRKNRDTGTFEYFETT